MLKELAEKGNLYDETDLRSRAAWLVRLAADQPEKASKEVHRAQALLERQVGSDLWSHSGVHRLQYFHLLGRVEIALYQGRSLEAWEILKGRWGGLERSLHFRVQLLRAEALGLRCRAAAAAAAECDEESKARRQLLRIARSSGRRLEAEELGWARALAGLVRAGAAALDGWTDTAVERLGAAEAGFEAAGFELYAVTCRRRRGQLLGSAGGKLIAAADAWMRRQGIVKPERMARVLAPGRWRP